MPPKMKNAVSWSQYLSGGILLVSVLAAGLRLLLLDWADPYHCNSLLNHGRWLDRDFRNWQPEGCMMHNYAPKEVDFCLKKKKVIFIGDSVTRQLFFSMARLADPALPAAPASSFEKHTDHTLTSGHGISFDFIWDPFLNSTKTDTILKGGGYSERDIPGLLVIGSGLWFLRYKEETGGIRAWEATVESVLDKIIRSMPELADEVIMVPVQEPDPAKLSPDRAAFINNPDIDAMNSDLMHRLSSTSRTLNDQEVPPPLDGSPTTRPSIPVLFPSVFNKVLDPSQTEDGLHYSNEITMLQAQILLNLRCNVVMPKHYPFDRTCCTTYPRPNLVQALFVFVIVFYAPLIWVFREKMKDAAWFQRISPPEKYILPISTFGVTIGVCYLADRTNLWLKGQKQYEATYFGLFCLLILVLGLLTVQRGTKDLGVLNRDQTDEWKGWMQLVILIYHYLGASKISGLYAPVRVLVASYLFMTGYGHTTYYLKQRDFSYQRVAKVLIRLNLLTIALAYAMNTDYQFYYFAPLVSFWYLVVYGTLAIGSKYNDRLLVLLIKIGASAALVSIAYSYSFLTELVFQVLERVCNIRWSAEEWNFRVNLDVLIVYVGMLTSIAYNKASELRIVDRPQWTWIHRAALSFCGLTLIWFFLFELSRADKFEYNSWHPFISILPVISYISLRNGTPVLRAASSELFGFIGRCSLETFILQYHLWLAADTKGVLIIVPGSSWRFVNFVVVAAIFIGISHRMAHATSEVTSLICGTGDEYRLPSRTRALPATEQTTNPGGLSSIRADEEHIPLQEPQTSSANDAIGDKVRDAGTSDGLEAGHRTLIPEEEESLRLEEGTWTPGTRSVGTNPPPSLPIRLATLAFCMWVLNVTWPDPPPPIP